MYVIILSCKYFLYHWTFLNRNWVGRCRKKEYWCLFIL